MEAVVLHRVGFLAYYCPKQGQDFKPSAAPLYPNKGQVPPPPLPGFADDELYYTDNYNTTVLVCARLGVALEASLVSQLFIFRTIFQPRALSSDIPAAERGLFTKYTATAFFMSPLRSAFLMESCMLFI